VNALTTSNDDLRLVRVIADGSVEQINLTEAVLGILRVHDNEWKPSDLMQAKDA
jgi:hypothetical protein